MPIKRQLSLCFLLVSLFSLVACTYMNMDNLAPHATINYNIATPTPLPVIAPTPALPFPDTRFVNRLKSGFFPGYLTEAKNAYFNRDAVACSEKLHQVKTTAFTSEPEKYYLLKALCTPHDKLPAGVTENITLALREKGSSSDILYAAAMIATQLQIYDEAVKRYSEAVWFDSLVKFDEVDFYLDMGTFQYNFISFGEARTNLEKALAAGSKSTELIFMLSDITIKQGDRKNAILYSRKLMTARPNTLATEMLLQALMTAANPTFHKRDINEAAQITKKLGNTSMAKADVGVAAVKALLLTNNQEAAEATLQISLRANPAEPRLIALDLQIKMQKTSQLGGTTVN